MILRQLAETLEKQQRMTARDLAKTFDTTEDAIDAMLGVWMRKGKVKKVSECGCSGGCCGQRSEIVYQWQSDISHIGFVEVA
jgi:putative ferrous iron transport protein C